MTMENLPVIKKEITFNVSKSKVWEALTQPEKIKEYLFGTTVISEWKAGSSIVFTGSWEGKEYRDKGTILKFEPEKVFQYDYWSNFSGLPDVPENYIILTFRLEEKSNACKLNFTQENSVTKMQYEHSDANWDAVFKKIKEMVEG